MLKKQQDAVCHVLRWSALASLLNTPTSNPPGFVAGTLQSVFPIRVLSRWTLNDTPCELYGWSLSLWCSKHCTGYCQCGHCHSPCGVKGRALTRMYKYYCGSLVLLAAVSCAVFNSFPLHMYFPPTLALLLCIMCKHSGLDIFDL